MTGLNPYDLALPVRRSGPCPCQVCGKPRERSPLLRPFRQPDPQYAGRDGHAGCDRDIQRWTRALKDVEADPGWQAAQHAADEAARSAREVADAAWAQADEQLAAADDVWETAARTLGLPDWFVDRAAARRRALREDEDR